MTVCEASEPYTSLCAVGPAFLVMYFQPVPCLACLFLTPPPPPPPSHVFTSLSPHRTKGFLREFLSVGDVKEAWLCLSVTPPPRA